MNWHPLHPTPPTKFQMMKVIKTFLQRSSFDAIFLATDTPEFVKFLRKQSPIPVLNFPQTEKNSQSPKNGHESVQEVLRDAWALSRCSALVHSNSNVSYAARLFRGSEYDARIKITLGQNPSTISMSMLNFIWRSVIPERIRREKLVLETSTNLKR